MECNSYTLESASSVLRKVLAMKDVQKFVLKPESELRFEVDSKSRVTIELTSGTAEVFGTELVRHRKYTFGPTVMKAIFTWQGCTIILTGRPEIVYVAKETPMVFYINVHAALEQMRQEAEFRDSKGPTVMLVGPVDVGKSTLCRLLLNYAVRLGRTPVFVDLDVGQGQISIPGTIGALVVEHPADAEEGFSQQTPLVYHYGHKGPGDSLKFYNIVVTRLADNINSKIHLSQKVKSSGIIINTCGWVKSQGYQAITHAAFAFEVDVILVVDQEKLCTELRRDVPSFVQIISIPKSGGAVERSKSVRAQTRDSRVQEYFYGLRTPLFPHVFDVKFLDIKIYRVGNSQEKKLSVKLFPVEIGPNLLHHVLALTFSNNVEEHPMLSNVAGFICVTGINMEQELLTVLSPQPQPLPNGLLLFSDVQFIDST
ncbi:polyribonucleotide 5'-hydroxyl-kinase Clp1-like isoform X2 [Tachypleus tridentatus]|uniref:polyribonucleotide 5'-hydroxyl-kinase Clp1-like isoform X2 n=1 Tax=Tachypleus tridentatus TaxID=6853 RepID=UPI003FCF726F